jgi:hypothetical protein
MHIAILTFDAVFLQHPTLSFAESFLATAGLKAEDLF